MRTSQRADVLGALSGQRLRYAGDDALAGGDRRRHRAAAGARGPARAGDARSADRRVQPAPRRGGAAPGGRPRPAPRAAARGRDAGRRSLQERSTTPTATRPATRCCARSRSAAGRRCARTTSSGATAARSSWSCFPRPTWRRRARSRSGCAPRSPTNPIKVGDHALPSPCRSAWRRSRPGTTWSKLFQRADAALYTAKQDGRNLVRVAEGAGACGSARRWTSRVAAPAQPAPGRRAVRGARGGRRAGWARCRRRTTRAPSGRSRSARARCTDADVEQACRDGRILRTHVLRPTWHFVLPADVRWMLALTAPRVRAAMAYYDRKLALDGARVPAQPGAAAEGARGRQGADARGAGGGRSARRASRRRASAWATS